MDNPNMISSDFIRELKGRIISSRYHVAKMANMESLKLYFAIGQMIDDKLKIENWGGKILDKISARLQQELPGLRGFSGGNLKKMRVFYNEWRNSLPIGSSLTNQLVNEQNIIGSSLTRELDSGPLKAFFSIPFTHHYEIISKVKTCDARWYYITNSAKNFWTVRHLRTELKNQSHLQEQQLPNNFAVTLEDMLSNKAIRAFKDQYLLDFVNVEDGDDEIDERVLENEIVLNIKKFLMSLGSDFSFLGNQYRLKVEDDEYFIDLLFFHRGLQALVAFELKKGEFKPEYVGKMNFYLSALDDLIKQSHENSSIGIILCKEKDNKKVEYSFRDFNKPMGVSTFITTSELPEQFKDALPDPQTLKKLLGD